VRCGSFLGPGSGLVGVCAISFGIYRHLYAAEGGTQQQRNERPWHHWGKVTSGACPVIAEDIGLSAGLAAMPERRLSVDEAQRFARDGVILLPLVIPNMSILEKMRPVFPCEQRPDPIWRFNGIAKALTFQSPLASLLASGHQKLHGSNVTTLVWTMAFFVEGDTSSKPWQSWHRDDHTEGDRGTQTQLNAWLALSDAPQAIEFIRGSHHAPTSCTPANHSGSYEPPYTDEYVRCLQTDLSRNLTAARGGEPARHIYSAKAGDVIMFTGQTFHRGWVSAGNRQTFVLRTFGGYDKNGQPFYPNAVFIYPPEKATFKGIEWPSKKPSCNYHQDSCISKEWVAKNGRQQIV